MLSPIVLNDNAIGGGVLLWACRKGDYMKLRYLLDQGCNPDTARQPRPRAILTAVSGGADGQCKYVRESPTFDVNVNVTAKKSHKTPLHAAITNQNFAGCSKLVRMLVDAGADVNARDVSKDRPLVAMFYDGRDSLPLEMYRQQVLGILLQADAEVNFFLVGTGDTPLHLAVSLCDAYAVTMLIFKGAHVHVKNTSESAPLHNTASQFRPGPLLADHAQMLWWLLRHGKDAIDELARAVGRTALHLTASAGCRDAVAMLIEHGTALLVRDSTGHTPLEFVTRSGDGDGERYDHKVDRTEDHHRGQGQDHLAAPGSCHK